MEDNSDHPENIVRWWLTNTKLSNTLRTVNVSGLDAASLDIIINYIEEKKIEEEKIEEKKTDGGFSIEALEIAADWRMVEGPLRNDDRTIKSMNLLSLCVDSVKYLTIWPTEESYIYIDGGKSEKFETFIEILKKCKQLKVLNLCYILSDILWYQMIVEACESLTTLNHLQDNGTEWGNFCEYSDQSTLKSVVDVFLQKGIILTFPEIAVEDFEDARKRKQDKKISWITEIRGTERIPASNSPSQTDAMVVPADYQIVHFSGDDNQGKEMLLAPHGNMSGKIFTEYINSITKTAPVGSDNTPIKVAVLDTGAHLQQHPCLWNMVDNIATFVENENVLHDPSSHGTHCAGIIASTFPYCRLAIGKVLPDNRYRSIGVQPLVQGIYWAVNDCKADVISLSLGCTKWNMDVETSIQYALYKGVVIVCAASNYGRSLQHSIGWPARSGNVICVGSHDIHGLTSSFSSVGRELELLAPGEYIPSTTAYGFDVMSGTSMATPYVAAIVALILLYDRRHRRQIQHSHQVRAVLREMCNNSGIHQEHAGYGKLNPGKVFYQTIDYFYNIIRDT